jgi:hypothetical protein
MEVKHKRSSIELALTVLKRGTRLVYHEELEERRQAIKELEAMIEHQEPVAYITGFHNGHCVIQPTDPAVALPVGAALCYSKEWIGLTSDDIHDAFCHAEYDASQDWNDDPEGWCKAFANYVEAKLKEKNT